MEQNSTTTQADGTTLFAGDALSFSKVDCSELPKSSAAIRAIRPWAPIFAADLQRTAVDFGKLRVSAAHFDQDCRGLW